jgi:hypothetical protein
VAVTRVSPVCEICGFDAMRPTSGGKFWCAACGYLQS